MHVLSSMTQVISVSADSFLRFTNYRKRIHGNKHRFEIYVIVESKKKKSYIGI